MSWSVIIPSERTNYVKSPVAQGALTTTYTVVGANTTITLSTTYSYLGYKSYNIAVAPATDNSGIALVLSTLTNAIHYVTVRVRGTLPTAWDWSLDNATFNVPTLLSTEGDWSVYGYQFPAAQANASASLKIYTKGAYACNYYIGHVQVELGSAPTTPITGDIKGFTSNGYYWNGTPHASSSTRSGQERSGGTVTDLYTSYNFKVQYGLGSGMPPILHHTQGMALLPGALFQGSKVQPRVLDLVSTTIASTAATVSAARKNFINAIKPDVVTPEQPVVFRYSDTNTSKPVDFYAYYDSGMEFQLNNGVVDRPIARFVAYDPFAYEVHTQSSYLDEQDSIPDADFIIRKTDNVWANLSTTFTNPVYALTKGIDGCIYIGGEFVAAGDADGDRIVKWNPYTEALVSLSTGIGSGIVYALATAPNGDIYIGGSFTDVGGAAGDRIAYWDGSAFNVLAASIDNNTVFALTFGADGTLYVGGSFTNVVDAQGDNITKWNGAAFSSLAYGVNDDVRAIALAPNGDIYVGGDFTAVGNASAGDTAAPGIAKWDGTTWSALGAGLTGGSADCYALAIDKAGNVYVGGDFTAADGVACNNIAKWNGKTFEPLGSGVNNDVYSLSLDKNEILYVGGYFTSAGGVTLSDRLAVWNGSSWCHLDVSLGGTPIVYSLLTDDLYIGYNLAGTGYGSSLDTVTNSGSASSYPIIHIKRADDGTRGIVTFIKNETTGDTLWCNYSLLGGETLTIDLTPGDRKIYSDYFGDVWRAVLRSSDISAFKLLPGINYISVYVSTDATITAWMEWKLTHWGADMVAA